MCGNLAKISNIVDQNEYELLLEYEFASLRVDPFSCVYCMEEGTQVYHELAPKTV